MPGRPRAKAPVRWADDLTPDTGLRMAAAALAWLLGIGLQMQQPALWPAVDYVVLMLAALSLLASWRWAWRGGSAARWRAAALSAGPRDAGLRQHGLARDLAPGADAAGRNWRAVTCSSPASSRACRSSGRRACASSSRWSRPCWRAEPCVVPERIALGWYRGFDGEALIASPEQELRAGQRWLLTARLRQPHGSAEPARLRPRTVALRTGHSRHRHGARHGGKP